MEYNIQVEIIEAKNRKHLKKVNESIVKGGNHYLNHLT